MKPPDEIAREIVAAHHTTRLPTEGLREAIAAAVAAEREAREKAEAELKEWKDSSASWKRECGEWRVLAESQIARAEKAEAKVNREVEWRKTAIGVAKAVARADALREAAAPYGQNPTSLFAGTSVEATLLRLIDKDAP